MKKYIYRDMPFDLLSGLSGVIICSVALYIYDKTGNREIPLVIAAILILVIVTAITELKVLPLTRKINALRKTIKNLESDIHET